MYMEAGRQVFFMNSVLICGPDEGHDEPAGIPAGFKQRAS